MRGNDTGVISPETGLRVKRYQAFLAAEATSGQVILIGTVSLRGVIPNSASAPITVSSTPLRKGRVLRCGVLAGTAGGATGEMSPIFQKRIVTQPTDKDGVTLTPTQPGFLPAACINDVVPFQQAELLMKASFPAATPFEFLESELAPDEREQSNLRTVAVAAGSNTTTTVLASGNAAFDQFYSGSLLIRADTGEGRIITAYTASSKSCVHAAWTKTPTTVTDGIGLIIRHDNRIVRPNDILQCTISATSFGGGTQVTNAFFYVDVLELATYNANNFA